MSATCNRCSRIGRVSNHLSKIGPRNAVFSIMSGEHTGNIWNSTALNHAAPCRFKGFSKSYKAKITASAGRKTVKKLKRKNEDRKDVVVEAETVGVVDGYDEQKLSPSVGAEVGGNSFASTSSKDVPSRGSVLQACTVTSVGITVLGLVIRQVSHVASSEGLPVFDCDVLVSFSAESWHLGLIAAIVVLISSSRYVLLKTWRDFAESSAAANTQVLSSLETFDYLLVAFLPGISEELLFRGALLPLFGLNWKSAFGVATIFGVLHFGNGRKLSFTLWATFVGFVYAYATIISSSIFVSMASHALNNFVGALLWRYESRSSD